MAQFSANYVPGGADDYHMPELIAPAPQRVMTEVPQNMQEDLRRLELEARSTEQRYNHHPMHQVGDSEPPRWSDLGAATMNLPNFSSFPRPKGDHIPPSFSEKEEILFKARPLVLGCKNVVMQLSWARDALQWVEIAAGVAAQDSMREGQGRERPATPRKLHELKMDAINIINYLYGQSHPEAIFMKGKWKERGQFGERENKKEAYLDYKRAAELHHGRAEYRMAVLYENEDDMAMAIEHYRIGAEILGDSAASYRLGVLYLLGQHGLRQNFEKGLQLINMAADEADEDAPQGAYVFGMLLARELPDIKIPEGVLPYDIKLAKNYIEKAAYLGLGEAQLKMGDAYEQSHLGCDFNPTCSLHYYALAAMQKQPGATQAEASLGVSRWFLFGSPDSSFDKDEALAFKYARDAAEAKLNTGEFAVGYYYEVGIHVQKDLGQARMWYETAAANGNRDAVSRIEALEHSKLLTKEDHETTTLTRIQSQHGSRRVKKRPEHSVKSNLVMATMAEEKVDRPSGRMGASPPVSLEGSNLAVQTRSTTPCPNDNKASTMNRSGSAPPYPNDDDDDYGTRGQTSFPSSHYNPGTRTSVAQADGSLNAFGIRSASPRDNRGRLSPGQRHHSPGPSRQDVGYRGRQPTQQSSYQHASPGRHGPSNGSPGPAVGNPVRDSSRNMLHKPSPGAQGSHTYPSPPPPGMRAASGHSYGSSDNGPPSRPGSAQPGRHGYAGPKLRPGPLEGQASRVSPQPQEKQSHVRPPLRMASPPASSVSTTSVGSTRPAAAAGMTHPDGKTIGNGPATFEAMGIPKGKNDDNCVVM